MFNKSHRDIFSKFKDTYLSKADEFVHIQKTVRRGTCQTPLNYIMQINNVEVTDLPIPFRLSHLSRKELIKHKYNYFYIGDNTCIRRSEFWKSSWQ